MRRVSGNQSKGSDEASVKTTTLAMEQFFVQVCLEPVLSSPQMNTSHASIKSGLHVTRLPQCIVAKARDKHLGYSVLREQITEMPGRPQ